MNNALPKQQAPQMATVDVTGDCCRIAINGQWITYESLDDEPFARAVAERINEALATAHSEVVPQGWKLVPVEPSEGMIAAAHAAYFQETGCNLSGVRVLLCAAIASAHAAPQELGCDACFERHCDGVNCTERAATTRRAMSGTD